jgi:hypothetical protein
MEDWFDALADLVGGSVLHGRVGSELIPRGAMVVGADFAPFDRIIEIAVGSDRRPARVLVDLPRRLERLALTTTHRWVRIVGRDRAVELDVTLPPLGSSPAWH